MPDDIIIARSHHQAYKGCTFYAERYGDEYRVVKVIPHSSTFNAEGVVLHNFTGIMVRPSARQGKFSLTWRALAAHTIHEYLQRQVVK